MSQDLQATPTAVEKYFFTPRYYPRSVFSVIGWWERRRLAYNVCVGTAGLISLGVMALLDPNPNAGSPFMPLLGAVIYGVAANACYTLGSVADLVARRTLGLRAPDLAPVMLRYGFVFSMGLSLLPIPVAIAARVVMLVLGVTHGR